MGSCIIYLTSFSVFIGGKSGPEYEKKKEKEKRWAKKYTLFPENTQRYLTAVCTLKIMCLNFRPEK